MGAKFPIKALMEVAPRLPTMNYAAERCTPGMFQSESELDRPSAAYIEAYGKVLDSHMDLSAIPKHFHTTYRVAAAHGFHQCLTQTTASEATSSTVFPTFTTAKLLTISKAYPQLRALQFFGFLPMSQPTGSLFFDTFTYSGAYSGSAPNQAAGDDTSDLTKFNKSFAKTPEGTNAPKITLKKERLDVVTEDYRIAATWSDRYIEDAERVFGENGPAAHLSHLGFMMGWTWDRAMIDATIAKVPAANKATFDATPGSSPNYATLSPSEQDAYDQRIYTVGFTEVIHKIRTLNKYGFGSDPTWVIVGPGIARLLSKIRGFHPVERGPADFEFMSGAIRDIGALTADGMRVAVDPMLDLDLTGQSRALFGRRPTMRDQPGHYLGVYVPMRVTRDFYDPNNGETTQAIWSSIVPITSNSGTLAVSVELDRIYGELIVTL